jgi:hypothetical protein
VLGRKVEMGFRSLFFPFFRQDQAPDFTLDLTLY